MAAIPDCHFHAGWSEYCGTFVYTCNATNVLLHSLCSDKFQNETVAYLWGKWGRGGGGAGRDKPC